MFLELTNSGELARVEEMISKRGWALSLKNRRKHVPILTEIKIRTCFLINSVKSREINHP